MLVNCTESVQLPNINFCFNMLTTSNPSHLSP